MKGHRWGGLKSWKIKTDTVNVFAFSLLAQVNREILRGRNRGEKGNNERSGVESWEQQTNLCKSTASASRPARSVSAQLSRSNEEHVQRKPPHRSDSLRSDERGCSSTLCEVPSPLRRSRLHRASQSFTEHWTTGGFITFLVPWKHYRCRSHCLQHVSVFECVVTFCSSCYFLNLYVFLSVWMCFHDLQCVELCLPPSLPLSSHQVYKAHSGVCIT